MSNVVFYPNHDDRLMHAPDQTNQECAIQKFLFHFFILADLCSGLAHKLHCNNFTKCHLCGNFTKSGNEDGCKEERKYCTRCSLKYWNKTINILIGVGVYMNLSVRGTDCLKKKKNQRHFLFPSIRIVVSESAHLLVKMSNHNFS